MLDFGMASSHGRSLWRPAERFADTLKGYPAHLVEQFPETAGREASSLEYAQSLVSRIRTGFSTLRQQLADYRPDVIIMVGDDQGDMFNSSNNPALAIYTGSEEMWGRAAFDPDIPAPEREKVVFQNHVELSRHLCKELIKRDFDIASMARFRPAGKPGVGISHMVARTVPEVDPSGTIPIVCVFINEYYAPMPSARRCIALGRAIAGILSERPERAAIYASGGLSHYPNTLLRGYVDIPLDTWILERLQRNDVAALEHLFAFDSDTQRAGTGEIRAWLTAAAAMNRKAEVIDYMPIHSGQTGVAFAYWPQTER
ncbi:protocatechuate 4,5-dioxygenase beta chain [Paraburkholderia sp. BL27I4N3]|uniref:DODA-type extradiol aromatic ring-opening family dioxygenase n=1 Tax=Paraburkholderia sp. BL27I4N3 TaxID=1938805 RepID=UPI000E2213AF|nr:hypothetical protein [Paraburkholderia sp. BL27I4N3]REE07425.1 protocatechuate 4,5-dioxygenase beta chain [Paraburkholderia sp. BL27I4N3]REE07436.1 protocatechuate 4,5-dioxygenase beta chain [Paraburkholderia sp. BL27I4N3]